MYPTVEVIAYHRPGKPPEPLRIRTQNPDGTEQVLAVDRKTDLKTERLNGNIMYVWKIMINQDGIQKEMGIKYERDTMLWYLMP